MCTLHHGRLRELPSLSSTTLRLYDSTHARRRFVSIAAVTVANSLDVMRPQATLVTLVVGCVGTFSTRRATSTSPARTSARPMVTPCSCASRARPKEARFPVEIVTEMRSKMCTEIVTEIVPETLLPRRWFLRLRLPRRWFLRLRLPRRWFLRLRLPRR